MVRIRDPTVPETAPAARIKLLLVAKAQLAAAVRETALCVRRIAILEVEPRLLASAESGRALSGESLEILLLQRERRRVFAEAVVEKSGGVGAALEQREERLFAL